MRDVPENELFSAYLDGELTAAEQAEVEELLARSPRARQLLEELRALSSTLQSLPAHRLDEDLSEKVLRMAERRILTERPAGRAAALPEADQPPAEDADTPSQPEEPPRWRRMLSPRSLSWSLVAIAAALLIMALDPAHRRDAGDDREVARAPEAAPAPEPAGERADARDARDEGLAIRALEKRVENEREGAAEPPSSEPPPEPANEAPAGGFDRPSAEAPAPAPAAPADESPAEQPAPTEAMKREAFAAKPAPAAPEDAAAVAADDGPVRSPTPDNAGPMRPATPPPADLAANGYRPTIGKTADQPLRGEGHGAAAAGQAGDRKEAGAGTVQPAGPAPQPEATGKAPVLLVQCDVSPEAVRTGEFDKLLAANGIRPDPAKTEHGSIGHVAEADRARRAEAPRDEEPDADAAGAPAAEPVELVYVEAGAAEIRSTLAALSARPGSFLTVSVNPAPGAESQRGLARFSRSRPAAPADSLRQYQFGAAPAQQAARPTFDGKQRGDSAAGSSLPEREEAGPPDTFAPMEPSPPEAAPPAAGQPRAAKGGASDAQGRAQRLALPGGRSGQGLAAQQPQTAAALADEQLERPGDGVSAGRAAKSQGEADPFADEPPTRTKAGERLAEKKDADNRSESAATPAVPPAAQSGAKPAATPAGASSEQDQPTGPGQGEGGPAQPETYRVLFVLRVVEPQGLANGVAAEAIRGRASAAEAAVEPARAAEPAEPAAEAAPAPSGRR